MALNVSITAARPYAAALIDIGKETGTLPRIHDELMALAKVYDEDPEFRAFFTSPRLDPDEKFRVLRKALGEEFSRPVLGLLAVLIRKGRELLLDNVADQFARFKDLAEGKVHIHVRTAQPLSQGEKDAIREKVEARTGKTALLHEKVDPSLIGGTVVRVGDVVVDGSLKRKLSALRKDLLAKEKLY